MARAGWKAACRLLREVRPRLRPDADGRGVSAAPETVDDDALGVDAIREVGPGGHFFGAAHTLARYTDAFYAPIISDWRNYQQWTAAGAPQAHQKASQLYRQALALYEQPPIDAAIAEELAAFVSRRKEEGGVPTDF